MKTQDDTEYFIKLAREWVAASAGIPPSLLPSRFENFKTPTEEHQRVLETVQNFSSNLRSHRRSLVLFGVPGSGKTHLAVSVMWDNAVIHPIYVNSVKMLADIRASWDRKYSDQPTEAELLARVLNANLLVMDDVGCGHDPNSFERRTLERILCERYDYRRPTIIATNLMIDQLKHLIGERAADRLAETADIVITPGASWRRQAQAQNSAAMLLTQISAG